MLRGIISSRYGISYVYQNDFQIVGFICAAENTKKLFKDIIINKGLLLTYTVLYNGFWEINRVIELIRAFFYFKKTKLSVTEAEMLFIAIEPRYRGREISKALVYAVLGDLKVRNITAVKVATIKENAIANRLLINIGFSLLYTFKFCNRTMNLYSYRWE